MAAFLFLLPNSFTFAQNSQILKTILLRDFSAQVLTSKEKILYFLLLFFFFALYMPGISWLYNVAMWLFFVYSFFFNTLTEKWALLKRRKEIILMLSFFLLNLISALLSSNQKEGIAFAGFRIGLLVIPFAIGTLYIKPILKDRIIFAFAVATACAATGSIIWALFQSVKYHDASLLYNDNLSVILNLQSIYFAMMINLAIFSFVYLLVKKSGLINKSLLAPALLILFVVHFLLASRIGIIILYSAIFIFATQHIIRNRKILEGVTLIMGLLLGIFLLLKFFPKTINRFKELTYTKFDFKSEGKESHFNVALTADQWNGANVRMAVWQCAWAVTKNNLLFGTGIGDKMDVLRKEYAKNQFTVGVKTNRNVHNNYLDVWMSLGLVGFIIFLIGFFILPVFRCLQTNDWYGIAIIAAFMLALFSESYMDRTMGNTLLGFFLAFISSYKKPSQ